MRMTAREIALVVMIVLAVLAGTLAKNHRHRQRGIAAASTPGKSPTPKPRSSR